MENNQVVKSKPTMSQILAGNSIKELGNSLSLTAEQINKAKSSALEISTNENLKECDPYSIIKFCFETARYNFSRNDCIYPVPYKDKNGVKKIQSQMGYKGFRELCLRGGYSEVSCNEVYSCDEVYRDEETGSIKVKFNKDINSLKGAKLIGFYAYAKENGEVTNTLYWSVEQLIAHGKHYSKKYDSVWGDNEGIGFNKMCKKTLIKQLCGELRTTPELVNAIAQDQIVHGGFGEQDEYLDNPNSHKKESSVKNKVVIDEIEEVEQVVPELVEPNDENDDYLSFEDQITKIKQNW